MLDHTHDPLLTSWITSANSSDTDFPIQNLPFGMFTAKGGNSRVGVAIGDQILDLSAQDGIESVLELMQRPRAERQKLRHRISSFLATYIAGAEQFLVPQSDVKMLLPCPIGNYTDFYASLHHAENVGKLFRPTQPLLPNYKWVPIAYHGRASSVVVSGFAVRRPQGQTIQENCAQPVYGPSRRLDYEVEIGGFLGPGNAQGETIPITSAEEHLFGICLLNDWSARDIQAWEYQPLGPFLAKSFATTISPWIVTLDALEPFRCGRTDRPEGDPEPLPYLNDSDNPGAFSIQVEAWIRTANMQEHVRLSQANFSWLYWTISQMIAHHASNGCPLMPGDLIGSGTISGAERHNRGCLLEINGKDGACELPNGEKRTFLEDGDQIMLRGWCEAPGARRIGLGACSGIILPAHER